MQINRLLEIVYVLLEQKAVTAKQLSEMFEVSQRTIYRDIDILSLAGIPVYSEKGRGGGILLLPEFVLNKSILSEGEQNEILSALQAVSGVMPSEPAQVLKKLSGLFKKGVTDWLQVDFSDWSFADSDFFHDLKKAILERRIAEFDYYGSSGKKTRRRIEPVQLWFKSKAWYINGFCLSRKDMRLFKLTRVRNLRITNKLFSLRDPSVTRSKPASEPQKHGILLKLKFDPGMAHRVYDEFDDKMIKKRPDGSFIVQVTWPEDHWLYGFLLSFGEYVEVLEPERIKKIIKNKAEKIFKKYI
ncbi:MAG: YafY family transcriptional regulator [Treponema sp.]|nr:YafY family transcriptional regulator [Treponema sp.]